MNACLPVNPGQLVNSDRTVFVSGDDARARRAVIELILAVVGSVEISGL